MRHRQVVIDMPPPNRLVKQFTVGGGASQIFHTSAGSEIDWISEDAVTFLARRGLERPPCFTLGVSAPLGSNSLKENACWLVVRVLRHQLAPERLREDSGLQP